jgi:hypothetical protein
MCKEWSKERDSGNGNKLSDTTTNPYQAPDLQSTVL